MHPEEGNGIQPLFNPVSLLTLVRIFNMNLATKQMPLVAFNVMFDSAQYAQYCYELYLTHSILLCCCEWRTTLATPFLPLGPLLFIP
ncbi:hypothetical protein JOB18_045750 [Solea senegalensis]|uniref:Uncharacterized protein n=1 Tax=Solea senegalensis TaxID=28829 RepID=A0AAV6REJ9_SOLSE|nr:hypothetical protein JOB18_045750 [Solea senegalensis]